jgi:hypothetical protein
MPDLIRHPEAIGFTGFSDKSENDVLMRFSTFYETIKVRRIALFFIPISSNHSIFITLQP